jgi:hypothetical protein
MMKTTAEIHVRAELKDNAAVALAAAWKNLQCTGPTYCVLATSKRETPLHRIAGHVETKNGAFILNTSTTSHQPAAFAEALQQITEVRCITGSALGEPTTPVAIRGYSAVLDGKLSTGIAQLRALEGRIVRAESFITEEGPDAERSPRYGRVRVEGEYVFLDNPYKAKDDLSKTHCKLRTVTMVALLEQPGYWDSQSFGYASPNEIIPTGAKVVVKLHGHKAPIADDLTFIESLPVQDSTTQVIALKGKHLIHTVKTNQIEGIWTVGTSEKDFKALVDR